MRYQDVTRKISVVNIFQLVFLACPSIDHSESNMLPLHQHGMSLAKNAPLVHCLFPISSSSSISTFFFSIFLDKKW